jgi:osmotically-inducible protein OsmY
MSELKCARRILQMLQHRSLIKMTAVASVLALSLSGCAGALIGAGATAGVAAYSERGLKGTARDTGTAAKVRTAMVQADDKLFIDVGIEVYEGRVLLTGRVNSEERRAEAVRLAWSVESVKDVINEIHVSESPLIDIANDSWITGQLSSKMTFDADILAINYSIETVGGVIYLIGIAQSQAELDRVIDHARSIKYVKQVVSHVRIKEPKAS